jgi:hypothetical protein
MLTDRRRSRRHAISRHAKLQLPAGSFPRDCVVSGISEGGVRLHVEGVDVQAVSGVRHRTTILV